MVWPWPLDVDAYVERGRQIEAPRPACPECAGTMQGWYGYYRHLREDRDRLIWIPRVRCRECGGRKRCCPGRVSRPTRCATVFGEKSRLRDMPGQPEASS